MQAVITGYGCRLPGAASPDAMWDVLAAGKCTVGTILPDRFPVAAFHDPAGVVRGKMYSTAAGQLPDLFEFDPEAFGISRREAPQIDPQQRLLLEVVRDAIEDGQHPPDTLAGDRTGVYVACSSFDHMGSFFADLARCDQGYMYGNAMSIVANRISRQFDLRGPSLTVDTACSSGLTALHLALSAIRAGEIDTAIVGGANTLMAPGSFVGFSQASMLSPTGRCHAFDAAADGYVRSDAVVAFVIRRENVARKAGDRVRASILACGINTDGAQGTAMAPSETAQITLMRRVREAAGRDPADIAMVEAHGTGTPVGDPVEAASVGAVWTGGRTTALSLGSSKSNFGHSEPAAGLVGMLKSILSLERKVVPPTLFAHPNPRIDFDALGLRLQATAEPMRGKLAVVNSFGFGGTNGCVVLERAEPPRLRRRKAAAMPFLPLSAPTEDALRALAGVWAGHLEGATPERANAMAARVWLGRGQSARRLALPLGDLAQGLAQGIATLRAVAETDAPLAPAAVVHGPGVALVFPGNGAQIPEMGVAIHAADPVWRKAFDTVAAAFRAADGPDLAAALGAPDLSDLAVAQGMLFATQTATARALMGQGVAVAATLGHSVGEIAAAHVAGILPLDMAARIIILRSKRLQTLAGQGGMAVVSASVDDLTPHLAEGVVVAAENGPRSTTISGPTEPLAETLEKLRGARIAAVRLAVDVPYHSPALDPLCAQMEADFAGLAGASGEIAFFGGAAGGLMEGTSFDAHYLWRNARAPVLFRSAVEAAAASGLRHFLELAPRQTLAGPIRAVLEDGAVAFRVLSSADTETQTGATCAMLAGRLWEAGVRSSVPVTQRHVDEPLPLTPFVRSYHRAPITQTAADPWSMLGYVPVLGRQINADGAVWDGEIAAGNPGWLADHAINGQPVMPGAMLFQMALRAMGAAGAGLELIDFAIRNPLAPADGGSAVRTRFQVETGVLIIEARPRLTMSAWLRIGDGTVLACEAEPVLADVQIMPDTRQITPDVLYAGLERLGLQYGPAFRLVRGLRLSVSEMGYDCDLATVPVAAATYAFNPFALDAALHGMGALLTDIAPQSGLYVPTAVRRLRVFGDASAPQRAQVRITARFARRVEVSVTLFDAEDRICLVAEALELTEVPRVTRRQPVRLWHEIVQRDRLPGADRALDDAIATRAMQTAQGRAGMEWVHALAGALAANCVASQTLSVVIDATPLPSDIVRLRALGFRALAFTARDPDRLAAARRGLPADLRGWIVPAEVLASRGADAVLVPDAEGEYVSAFTSQSYVFRPGAVPQRGAIVAPETMPGFIVMPAEDGLARQLAPAPDPALAEVVLVLRPSDVSSAQAITDALGRVQATLLTKPSALSLVAIGCSPIVTGALRAFVRSLRNEYPAPLPRLIVTEAEDAALLAALRSPARPLAVELDKDHAVTRALVPADTPADKTPLRLGLDATGAGIASLGWRPMQRPNAAAGEVLVRVRAVGLNYRDVMVAQGLLPDRAVSEGRFGRTIGFECSGEVIESNSPDFTPGMRVMALAPDAAATHVIAPPDAVFPLPDGISFEAAAGLSVTYATAHIALVETGRIASGERVLIHGAAGGVGLAAIRVAKACGARVFATAGTEEKRALCLAEGAEWVGNSRSLGFAPALRAVTGGVGVDVIVNSLAGAAAQQSLELLAPFGRFIELGKRGFVEGAHLRTAALRLNQSWSAVDLDHMMKHVPGRVRAAMAAVRADLQSGKLTPLPVEVHPAEDALHAFERLLHARHVGKVVLTPPGPDTLIAKPVSAPFTARGSWLVTGGTGAIGLRLGRWLREAGAEKVWLVSRNAQAARDERDDILDWLDSDPGVRLRDCDVADEAVLAALLAEIDREGPPLDGVIHGAGALRDTSIRDLDAGDIGAVLRPKLTGAEVLDRLTRDMPPRHMLFLSSVSVPLGTMGQASYVAANGGMEAVAEARAAAGLPARVLALGPVAGRGMAVRSGLLRAGAVDLIAVEELGPLVACALTSPVVWTLAARIDWGKLAPGFASLADPAFDRVLIREAASERGAGELLARLRGLSPIQARREIEKALINILAGVLRTEPARIDPLRPLTDLGLDSLLALELKLEVESSFGQAMPGFGLGEVVTTRLLAHRMQDALGDPGLGMTEDD